MSDPNPFDDETPRKNMRRKSSNSGTARVIHPDELRKLLEAQKEAKKEANQAAQEPLDKKKSDQKTTAKIPPPPFVEEMETETPLESESEPTSEPKAESTHQPNTESSVQPKQTAKKQSPKNRKKPPRVQRDWSDLETQNAASSDIATHEIASNPPIETVESTEKTVATKMVKMPARKKPKQSESNLEPQSKPKSETQRKLKREPKLDMAPEATAALQAEPAPKISNDTSNDDMTPSDAELQTSTMADKKPAGRRHLPRSKPLSAIARDNAKKTDPELATPQKAPEHLVVSAALEAAQQQLEQKRQQQNAKQNAKNKQKNVNKAAIAVTPPPFAETSSNDLGIQHAENPRVEPHLEIQTEAFIEPHEAPKLQALPAEEENTTPWLALLPWWGLSLLWIALDQFSKLWVQSRIQLGTMVEVAPHFNLVHILNPGAAFSFLASHSGWQRYFLSGVAVIASVVIVFMMRSAKNRSSSLFFLASILGGALGNLLDRLMHGAVIDFLDFYAGGYHWPAFNVADVAITIGAVGLIVDELFFSRKRSP